MRSRKQERLTIIKRTSRKHNEAHHGGAWKVAFADFTLAMMALFMVLWIMEAVSEKERREIVSMLNGVSILDNTGFTVLNDNSGIPETPLQQPVEIAGRIDQLVRIPDKRMPVSMSTPAATLNAQDENNRRARREIEELARIILKITAAYDARNNLTVELVPQGLRILVADDRQREMFRRSSAELTPFFRELLTSFAPALNQVDNKIIITGHTDATPYRDQEQYNNWNLSGERALQARSVLTAGGLDPRKVLQVSGMADQVPLNPADPLSSTNRRVEIMVLTHSASNALYDYFGQHGEKVIAPLIDKLSNR